MIIRDPGVYDLSLDDYLLDPCSSPSLSRSLAVDGLTRSWRYVWERHPKLNPAWRRTYPEQYDLGSAVHEYALLGPDRFVVLDYLNYKTNAAKQQRDLARKAGMIPILHEQMRQVEAMAAALSAQAAQFAEPKPLTDGKAEQTLIWREGAIWCRARPDFLHTHHKLIEDLKTTDGNGHPAEWGRKLFERGFDVQDAFYRRGYKALTGVEVEFRFVVAETEPPYALSVVALDPEARAFADSRVETAIEEYATCLRTGRWPAYPDRVCYQELPPWVQTRFLERAYYVDHA